MRALLLPLTLSLLLISCTTSRIVPVQPQKCKVPEITAPPPVSPTVCQDLVCMTAAEIVSLAQWMARVAETRDALSGCTLVEKVSW